MAGGQHGGIAVRDIARGVRVAVAATTMWAGSGCADAAGPADPGGPLTGTWRGEEVQTIYDSPPVTLRLTQRDSTLTGTWAAGANERPVSGTYVAPYVSLVVRLPDGSDARCGGEFAMTASGRSTTQFFCASAPMLGNTPTAHRFTRQ